MFNSNKTGDEIIFVMFNSKNKTDDDIMKLFLLRFELKFKQRMMNLYPNNRQLQQPYRQQHQNYLKTNEKLNYIFTDNNFLHSALQKQARQFHHTQQHI